MTQTPNKSDLDPAKLQSLKIGGHTYEQRLNDCGKPNCTRCAMLTGRSPSHGPYWYLCVSVAGHWRRVYIGKNLDIARFVTPSGEVDWGQINNHRAMRASAKSKALPTTPPAP